MYLEVCDGNMQEGSFRCDANVSVRPKGASQFGTRAEIKNVNSFRFVEKAIEYEISRQIQVIQSGGKVVQETRLYDSGKNVTVSMRSKEEAHDYRYFPEPDLLPLKISSGQIAALRNSLPELPEQKRDRYVKDLNIPAYDATVITSDKKLAHFFEASVKVCGEPKTVSNWVMGEVLRVLKDKDIEIDALKLTPAQLGELLKMIKAATISNSIAKTVFEEMVATGKAPGEIVKEKGLAQVSDTLAIEKVIDEIMAANPGQLAEYRSGKDKLFGFFVGQTMKAMQGKANPGVINELLKKKL
jgi:aspartyl-tRNA(Asn)/glutamyl-tRNA(Gln) amidotransferase subunit B